VKNRALSVGADGSFTLRPGRLYRLLVVVNGNPQAGELESAMTRIGFARHDVAISSSAADWAEERPHDWPEEPASALAANESLARISGSFSGGAMRVLRDTPIAGGGTFTIVGAWDYGSAPTEIDATTGASARSSSADGKRTAILIGTAALVTGIAVWNFMSSSRRLEREEERYNSLAARAERARVGARIQQLMREGHSPGDAEAIAVTESAIPDHDLERAAPSMPALE
jgi:hypothetical protein